MAGVSPEFGRGAFAILYSDGETSDVPVLETRDVSRRSTLRSSLNEVLDAAGVRPVLFDLGASGRPPAAWSAISRYAVYVGFDIPTEIFGPAPAGFAEAHVVPRAVVAADVPTVTFHVTRSPFCSSTLPPASTALANYAFSELFEVENTVEVPATTLGVALQELDLRRVHWFKADTQGTDLRLFRSLPESIRQGVLAVDVEPGLIDAYVGEDLFVDAHRYLASSGFWLSRLKVQGTVRMRRSTLDAVAPLVGTDAASELLLRHRTSPCWCEARYLRTLESLAGCEREDWALAWVFAMADDQPAFAADLAIAYREHFGGGSQALRMLQGATAELHRLAVPPPHKRLARRILPVAIRRMIYRLRVWVSSGKEEST